MDFLTTLHLRVLALDYGFGDTSCRCNPSHALEGQPHADPPGPPGTVSTIGCLTQQPCPTSRVSLALLHRRCYMSKIHSQFSLQTGVAMRFSSGQGGKRKSWLGDSGKAGAAVLFFFFPALTMDECLGLQQPLGGHGERPREA